MTIATFSAFLAAPLTAHALELPSFDLSILKSPAPVHSMTPGTQSDLDCLTQAVYYEAALEPAEGQEAVAQVVMTRLRKPHFPKTVCGVVYDGSLRKTGCQFTFTCDGSLARKPDAGHWLSARKVAAEVLAGRVVDGFEDVTHYHAVWMKPAWSSSLTPVRRIGGHLFYREPRPDDERIMVSPINRSWEPGARPTAGRQSLSARTAKAQGPLGGRMMADGLTVWGLPVSPLAGEARLEKPGL